VCVLYPVYVKKDYMKTAVSLVWAECYFYCCGVIAFTSCFFSDSDIVMHVNLYRELVWET
jgi:hypothetical protein